MLRHPAIVRKFLGSMTAPTSSGADLSKLRINRDTPPSRDSDGRFRSWLQMSVPILIIVAAAYYVISHQPKVIKVTTVAAATGATTGPSTSVTANGYVVARTKASVSAKAAGRLEFLGVSEGSYVRKGTVIARLDNADFLAAIAQAEANVASAEATRIEAESDRDQMRRESKRLRDMRAVNQSLISQQEVDVADSRTAQSEARLNAAMARKSASESALQLARANNENTIIRAPFTGTVLRKDAEVGEVVAPSVGGGLTRGAVVTMADLATLEVEVDVNEAYIARVTNGLKALITLDAYPDTAFRGVVRQVVPTADRQRATVQVKVSISDSDPRILPEMGAKVDFLQPENARADTAAVVARTVFRVPQEAVRESNGESVVWVVRDGKLTRRVISAGPVSAGYREVRIGLSGGEQLLLSGVETPTEGMKVKISS
jgi:RND family efflux transporter MFP subunit